MKKRICLWIVCPALFAVSCRGGKTSNGEGKAVVVATTGWTAAYAAMAGAKNVVVLALFKMVADIEKHHEERYQKLLGNIEKGLVFSKDGDRVWICRNCGHIHIGKAAPQSCPVCAHPQAYFEIKADNY